MVKSKNVSNSTKKGESTQSSTKVFIDAKSNAVGIKTLERLAQYQSILSVLK